MRFRMHQPPEMAISGRSLRKKTSRLRERRKKDIIALREALDPGASPCSCLRFRSESPKPQEEDPMAPEVFKEIAAAMPRLISAPPAACKAAVGGGRSEGASDGYRDWFLLNMPSGKLKPITDSVNQRRQLPIIDPMD